MYNSGICGNFLKSWRLGFLFSFEYWTVFKLYLCSVWMKTFFYGKKMIRNDTYSNFVHFFLSLLEYLWLIKLYLVFTIYCDFFCLYNWNKWHLKKNTECSCYTRVIWDKYWLESLEMIQRLRKKFGAFLSHLHTRDSRTGSFSFVLHTVCLHFNYCFILVTYNPLDILNVVILNGNISGWVLL